MMLTSVKNQTDLPRYFARVFDVAQSLGNGRIDVVLDDGRAFRAEGRHPGPAAVVEVHNPDIFARLIREGDLGFLEAYIDGWWTTPDLQAFMDLVHGRNDALYDGFPGIGLVRALEKLRHWLRGNSLRQARKNIAAHYDLGNEFYRLWLDETMTYSSALFRSGQEPLEKAQHQKYESMVDQMGVQPGDHVLEIGCGWGGFAEYAAAERGVRVTGLTLSKAQHDYAVERIRARGLQDRVEIRMQDYRDDRGLYDGIASIEMFEAVGEKYWPTYFQVVRDRLKPGRNATLQIITVQDARFATYRKGVDFIQKHIFPGGMLPSPGMLRDEVRRAGLQVSRSIEFGDSYSQTLRRWHGSFNEHWEEISQLGFDDRFRRMWNLYLTSSAGAFQGGHCDVTQITITRPAA
ncbi:class I SAM-dependent methyltransferase [Thioclava sp. 15-R06ZXC-3]|uniref:Class I SAM-dependent methyltransferase n=1 Tax=Thioclava arctica TaxID=3238301 RepID=A0ABV3TPW0_9RHOB